MVWGGSPADLAAELTTLGCDFVSAWAGAASEGFVGYLLGAPEIVNRDWLLQHPDGGVPQGTPLAIVCRSTGSSAPAVHLAGAAVSDGLRGLPSTGGIGLAVWSGALSALATGAAESGCTLVSAWTAGSQGELIGYLLGAPEIVNRAWLSEVGEPAVPAGTPLVIVCRSSAQLAPAPSAPSAPSSGSPGADPILRGSATLPP